ncbi:hypothetical protein ACJX0J_023025, partial [Zea mays]
FVRLNPFLVHSFLFFSFHFFLTAKLTLQTANQKHFLKIHIAVMIICCVDRSLDLLYIVNYMFRRRVFFFYNVYIDLSEGGRSLRSKKKKRASKKMAGDGELEILMFAVSARIAALAAQRQDKYKEMKHEINIIIWIQLMLAALQLHKAVYIATIESQLNMILEIMQMIVVEIVGILPVQYKMTANINHSCQIPADLLERNGK